MEREAEQQDQELSLAMAALSKKLVVLNKDLNTSSFTSHALQDQLCSENPFPDQAVKRSAHSDRAGLSKRQKVNHLDFDKIKMGRRSHGKSNNVSNNLWKWLTVSDKVQRKPEIMRSQPTPVLKTPKTFAEASSVARIRTKDRYSA